MQNQSFQNTHWVHWNHLSLRALHCSWDDGTYRVLIIFQKLSTCNIGQHLKHNDRTGRDKLLLCTGIVESVPQWKFVDGKETNV